MLVGQLGKGGVAFRRGGSVNYCLDDGEGNCQEVQKIVSPALVERAPRRVLDYGVLMLVSH